MYSNQLHLTNYLIEIRYEKILSPIILNNSFNRYKTNRKFIIYSKKFIIYEFLFKIEKIKIVIKGIRIILKLKRRAIIE